MDYTIVNIVGAALMLLYTSYLDMKKREVEDKVWVAFGVFAALLQAYEVLYNGSSLAALGISLALAAVVGLGLFFLGFYGGADGKALIVLAAFVPQFTGRVHLYSIAPLIVLTNGVLISILLPAGLLILNVSRLLRNQPIFDGFSEPLHRKILACLLGFKQTGRPRSFQFVMERKEEADQGKRFDFSLMHDDFETKTGTWVTPGIPLLVFFTAGYFVMLAYGDLVIGLIQFIAKAAGF